MALKHDFTQCQCTYLWNTYIKDTAIQVNFTGWYKVFIVVLKNDLNTNQTSRNNKIFIICCIHDEVYNMHFIVYYIAFIDNSINLHR